MKHNNTPALPVQAAQMQKVLENLLGILQNLDGPRFRAVTDTPDNIPDEVILEAMHKTRLEHPGINRVLRAASKRWLREFGS